MYAYQYDVLVYSLYSKYNTDLTYQLWTTFIADINNRTNAGQTLSTKTLQNIL